MTSAVDNKAILIVEDDPFIAMDLEDTFESCGFKVLGPVADVDTGLKMLKSTEPDFAMLDYNLGRETSIELARVLTQKRIPYVFLTGQIEKVVIDHDIEPRPIVSKPFVPERLVAMVEAMIA